jgi:hypothetical protein
MSEKECRMNAEAKNVINDSSNLIRLLNTTPSSKYTEEEKKKIDLTLEKITLILNPLNQYRKEDRNNLENILQNLLRKKRLIKTSESFDLQDRYFQPNQF